MNYKQKLIAAIGAAAAASVVPLVATYEGTVHSSYRDPIGIVIADGGAGDRAPRFSAFVWGPVPDEELEGEAPFPPVVADQAQQDAAHEALVFA